MNILIIFNISKYAAAISTVIMIILVAIACIVSPSNKKKTDYASLTNKEQVLFTLFSIDLLVLFLSMLSVIICLIWSVTTF